ncbi:MAG TPA: MaoC family dehydratase N-terminal domain-containing protein [Euzebyales bacterium]|nr:MaoC family dehydratase N-terminal domain-containing protein [Euzebyales bacterium]
MALNPQRVGFRYAPYRYEVGREAVRAYARATGVDDPRYQDDAPDAGAVPLAVPPAFVACAAGARAWTRMMDDPELGAHPRLMHVGQEFDFRRPVHVGDVLVCTPTIADISAARGLELLTLEVHCAATDGAPVVTSRSRLVFIEAPA